VLSTVVTATNQVIVLRFAFGTRSRLMELCVGRLPYQVYLEVLPV
jgi:hypothetical protein